MQKNNYELSHSGTKGMKWGRRRYQYEDRRWTPEGKIRYGRKGRTINLQREHRVNKAFDKSIKTKNGNISPAEDSFSKANRAVNEATNVIRTAHRTKKNSAVDKMSDTELRNRINRLNMEKQYSDLTSADTSKGYNTIMDILSVTGSVLAIGAAATGIVSNIKDIKHTDVGGVPIYMIVGDRE